MPLIPDSNIKPKNSISVTSDIELPSQLVVNEKVYVSPDWLSVEAGDNTVYYQKDAVNSDNAWATGTANVKEDTSFDFSAVDNQQPGEYPVNVSLKNRESTYFITIQEVTMSIEAVDYTDTFFISDPISFDGRCIAHYNKPGIDKEVTPVITYPEEFEIGTNLIQLSYYDSYYGKSASITIEIEVLPSPDEETVIADFSAIEDFDQWSSSYVEHSIDYSKDINVTFVAANRQESIITDIPVVRGQPVIISSQDSKRWIRGVAFTFRQWQTKAQTVILDYSVDGGINWIENVTSSDNFSLMYEFEEGIQPDQVRLRFGSSTNQIGVEQGVIYTVLEDEPVHRLHIEGPDSAENGVPFQLTAACTGEEDEVTWSSEQDVTFESIDNMSCMATANENGLITVTATCLGATASKNIVVTGSSSYQTIINFPELYTEDTTLQDVTITSDDINVSFNKGDSSTPPKYYKSGTAARIYAKNTIYFATEGYNITKITFEITQDKDMTCDVGTYEKPNWVGSNSEITFTVSGANGHIRIRSITIAYTDK